MQQPNAEQRQALKQLWLNGQGPVAVYFRSALSESMQTVLDTEDKKRDEASGEAKAIQTILAAMSGADEARHMKTLPT